jgi:hypothetical protein
VPCAVLVVEEAEGDVVGEKVRVYGAHTWMMLVEQDTFGHRKRLRKTDTPLISTNRFSNFENESTKIQVPVRYYVQ